MSNDETKRDDGGAALLKATAILQIVLADLCLQAGNYSQWRAEMLADAAELLEQAVAERAKRGGGL